MHVPGIGSRPDGRSRGWLVPERRQGGAPPGGASPSSPEAQDQLFRRMLDEVDAAVIATDLDYRVEFWNKGAERLFGWTSAEALGRTTLALLDPERPESDLATLREHSLAGSHEGEYRLTRKDGSTVLVLTRLAPVVDDSSEPQGFIGVSVDITARRAVEDDLRATTELLHALTDSMAEGMFALDAEGRVIYLNPVAAALLGVDEAELLGEVMHDRTHHHRPDGTAYPHRDCPISTTGSGGGAVTIDRDVFFRADGSSFPVSYTASGMASAGLEGCVVVFRDITQQLAEEQRLRAELEKLTWLGRIQDALEEGCFELYAQPILRLEDGVVTRHELLLRMTCGGEVVLPGAFLGVAEEFGLIGRIDRWVVQQAARLAASGHCVQFNLSAHSVADPTMVSFITSAIDAAGAAPDRLICEITETALIEDRAAAAHLVDVLSALGCGVALDDFGAGYGGFAYLKSFYVSILKIDRQFVVDIVQEPASQHVVRAVVSLALAFGLETIAEGVETLEALDVLRELGVDHAQGYAVGHPRPLDIELTPTRQEPSHDRIPRR
jgi:PAS domain S-box-containing protein